MDLVCFSHLHWNFVYQRPQHLLTRFTSTYRVFYIQEFTNDASADGYSIDQDVEQVWVIKPNLDSALLQNASARKITIINQIFQDEHIETYLFWFYTPMSIHFTQHLHPLLTVYDCMDELSAFKFADPQMKNAEYLLFQQADLVFTGGNNLYEAKKNFHRNVHAFPSSIDKAHFGQARNPISDNPDQVGIPHPRLGFFGVLDERFDIELIDGAAQLRPDWHFILIGPVVKIDPGILPKHPNIHYLGSKKYSELPGYLSGWDIALIPFAINESTKYISPTKTPEYLAAGKPVISTPITDVIYPYGKEGLVKIAEDAEGLVDLATIELNTKDKTEWLAEVDDFLADISWDSTWARMNELIKKELELKQHLRTLKKQAYV